MDIRDDVCPLSILVFHSHLSTICLVSQAVDNYCYDGPALSAGRRRNAHQKSKAITSYRGSSFRPFRAVLNRSSTIDFEEPPAAYGQCIFYKVLSTRSRKRRQGYAETNDTIRDHNWTYLCAAGECEASMHFTSFRQAEGTRQASFVRSLSVHWTLLG